MVFPWARLLTLVVCRLGTSSGSVTPLDKRHSRQKSGGRQTPSKDVISHFDFDSFDAETESDLSDPGANVLRRAQNPVGDKIIYDHMPKTGGTFISFTMKESVGPANYKLIREFDGLSKEQSQSSFTIGSVRNPCDYYVSLWSYGVDAGGSMYNSVPNASTLYHTKSPKKDSAEDIAKFRSWLRAISMRDKPGTYSVRMASSYGGDLALQQHSEAASALDSETMGLVRSSLKSFTKDSIDCWIREENLKESMRGCLAKWETNTGKTVHWDKFERCFSPEGQEEFEAGHAAKNGNSHAACQIYFDRASMDLVKNIDGKTAAKFGYNSCCSLHSWKEGAHSFALNLRPSHLLLLAGAMVIAMMM